MSSESHIATALKKVKAQGFYLTLGLLNEEPYDMAWGTRMECSVWVMPSASWFDEHEETAVCFLAQNLHLEDLKRNPKDLINEYRKYKELCEGVRAEYFKCQQADVFDAISEGVSVYDPYRKRIGACIGLTQRTCVNNVVCAYDWGNGGEETPPGIGYLIDASDRIATQTLQMACTLQDTFGSFQIPIDRWSVQEGVLKLEQNAPLELWIAQKRASVVQEGMAGFGGEQWSESQWGQFIAMGNWIDWEWEFRWLDRLSKWLKSLGLTEEDIGYIHLSCSEHIYWGSSDGLSVQLEPFVHARLRSEYEKKQLQKVVSSSVATKAVASL